MSARPTSPPVLRLVRDFVNTLDVESGSDRLEGPDGVRSWLREHDLAAEHEAVTDADAHRLREVREAFRELLEGNAGGTVRSPSVAVLNRAASAARVRLVFDDEGVGRLVPEADGVNRAIARILTDAYVAMVEGVWDRLKVCRNDECRWAFYDHSKNHSGKWCTMRVCGNRMKARTYRRRQVAASPEA